jgi:hypothetical protein
VTTRTPEATRPSCPSSSPLLAAVRRGATADTGHCIAVVVQSAAGAEIDPDRCLVALPVKTVVRVGWTMRDGYVVCDVPYGSSGAKGVEEADEEFDGLTINT